MEQREKERIEAALADLESALPPREGKVRIDLYGGGWDESYLRGDEIGLLRMGLGIAKAAIAPYKDRDAWNGDAVSADITDVFHDSSTVRLDWVERTDDLTSASHLDEFTEPRLRWERLWNWFWNGLAIVVVVVFAIAMLFGSR